jgi:UDPglucose 6-dehydrogenase
VIVTKSTVPVGTGDEVERIIRELRPDADFAVVSNPEFLREGAAIEDFKRPDRIVIGTEDLRAQGVMTDVYRPLYLNSAPILNTSRRTAELTKYAANAFLATKITFINEMADLCEKVGANVQDVARGMGLDNRIGAKFLHAGRAMAAPASRRTRWRWSRPPRTAEPDPPDRDGGRGQRQRKRAWPQGGRGLRRLGRRQDASRARPGLQAQHRRHARCALALDVIPALQAAGARIIAYDPESMEQARHCCQLNVGYCRGAL